MKGETRLADIYIRFLNLAETLRGLPTLPALDPLEERILSFIAIKAQEAGRLSVRDLMDVADLGSPATIHSRLTSMRKKGWIGLADTTDRRRKQIELTSAALQHFNNLSALMLQAATNK